MSLAERTVVKMSSTDIPLGSSDPAPALRKDLVTLQAQRDALEVEADAITSELKAPGPNGEAPVGVKGSLIDPDGFPLAGFDLFNVREKRHRLVKISHARAAVRHKCRIMSCGGCQARLASAFVLYVL